MSGARGGMKPEVTQLESQLKSLLASHKELTVKINRLETENKSLSEQYDTATLKVIKAERKLDRVRSAQVQKLEQQALANSTTRPTSTDENGAGSGMSNGDSAELKAQHQEAVAIVAKQKEHIKSALSDIKALQEENSGLKIKKDTASDEDYARTDVFKQFKVQNEDLIKRINHLEATNKLLREDAEKLRAERTEYQTQVRSEAELYVQEVEDQIHQKDQDLTRIRSARDELLADQQMRKQSQDLEKNAPAHLQELIEAKDDRIKELESELERLRPSEDVTMTTPREDLEAMSTEELRQKYLKLEKDFESINKELPLLEKSYKKAMGLAHKKVMDFGVLEERVAVLTAEKSKADQKYFAARKDMDTRTGEIRTLRQQNGKSSEIISQLKEAEMQNRALMVSLEKQIADLRQSNTTTMAENKKLESLSADAARQAERAKAQIPELTGLVRSRDATVLSLKEQVMNLETDQEKLKVRLNQANKDCDKWRHKSQGNSSVEEEALRVSANPCRPGPRAMECLY